MGTVRFVASPSRVSDETGLSALCKAVAPAQVQVSYCATNALPFRVEWNADMARISFAGSTPDEAAERALAALRRRALPTNRGRAERATEPSIEPDFAEAMRERIWEIEERRRRKRPSLRLVR